MGGTPDHHQAVGSVCECFRVVFIGKLVSANGLRVDPFRAMFNYTLLACPVLMAMSLLTETTDFMRQLTELKEHVGICMLVVAGLNAFVLNASTVFLIWPILIWCGVTGNHHNLRKLGKLKTRNGNATCKLPFWAIR